MIEDGEKKMASYTFSISESLDNEFHGSKINKIGEWNYNQILVSKGDMAKLVDATDLIGLSLGMETC